MSNANEAEVPFGARHYLQALQRLANRPTNSNAAIMTKPRHAEGYAVILSKATLNAYVADMVDLWTQQKRSGINLYPHPAPAKQCVASMSTYTARRKI
ncbi:hypothetical protein SEPCBS119000_005182 [Sporothrix epigloea]|uniref:Uncharacterized protein n=1 Tax=Sporothrix epigloea TaxID=1892477 RepID=A0ABP0DXD2_9PEZI